MKNSELARNFSEKLIIQLLTEIFPSLFHRATLTGEDGQGQQPSQSAHPRRNRDAGKLHDRATGGLRRGKATGKAAGEPPQQRLNVVGGRRRKSKDLDPPPPGTSPSTQHPGQTPDREVRQAERNTHQTNHDHLNRPSVALHHKVQFQEDQKSVGSLAGEPDQQHREAGTSNKQAKTQN